MGTRTQQCSFCGHTHICTTEPFAWDGIHCPYNPVGRTNMDRNYRPKRVKCHQCNGSGKMKWLAGLQFTCTACKGRGFEIVEEK